MKVDLKNITRRYTVTHDELRDLLGVKGEIDSIKLLQVCPPYKVDRIEIITVEKVSPGGGGRK